MASAMASIDDRLNEIRHVRNDIWRCRRRLKSELSDLERKVLEDRLLDRQSAFERLLATTFPFTLTLSSEIREPQVIGAQNGVGS